MNKMLAIMPVWYLSSKMDFEDPTLIMNMRMGFFGLMGTLVILCMYMYTKLTGSPPDKTTIWIKEAPSFAEPKPSWKKSTYFDKDMADLKAAAGQVFSGLPPLPYILT